jgi:GT2 family glycosyltransferase
MSTPLISIVVPVWDEAELTRRCAASVRAHTAADYELIGIDNGSGAAAASVVQSDFDLAVRNDVNRGFAAAMNQGLRRASGRLVLFLNNDTEVPAGWAERLTAHFDRDGVGLVVPAVTAAGNAFSVRSEPGGDAVTIPPFTEIPSGVAYLIAADVARGLSGWSEEYGLASGEDLDLLFTVWANGLDVVFDGRVLVEHRSAASAERLPDRTRMWRSNRARFVAKWKQADERTVPRLESTEQAVFAERLRQAAVAATWMERWFAAKDALHDELHPEPG